MQNNSVKSDTTCSDCDKDFYYMTVLNRHTQLYAWACASCGECFKTKEEECCNRECTGALHIFKKLSKKRIIRNQEPGKGQEGIFVPCIVLYH